jgi:hypothetical protein
MHVTIGSRRDLRRGRWEAFVKDFLRALETQRWDDHRYYHHSRINQSLHFLSALSFLVAYAMLFIDPALAAAVGWLIAMVSRQAGHFFFEPKGYDHVNHATHQYKERIKVGYNLRRKVVLMGLWAASPLVLWVDPTLSGMLPAPASGTELLHRLGLVWLTLGAAGLLFRALQLFITQDLQTGLVWVTKILTDPFHDLQLYAKSLPALWGGKVKH